MNYKRPSPVELAKEIFETADRLMVNTAGEPPTKWEDLDVDMRAALSESVEKVVCKEIDRLLEMCQDLELDIALDRTFDSERSEIKSPGSAGSIFPEAKHEKMKEYACYYCGKYAVYTLGGACERCSGG